jgi:signal transduction histidine kinase
MAGGFDNAHGGSTFELISAAGLTVAGQVSIPAPASPRPRHDVDLSAAAANPFAMITRQDDRAVADALPPRTAKPVAPVALAVTVMIAINALVLYVINLADNHAAPAGRGIMLTTMWLVFGAVTGLLGALLWWQGRVRAGMRAAATEAAQHTALLQAEIAAHRETDAALTKAKEAAEAANLAKSRYLVGVSHEIRSPLNAIYGYAQLLERNADIEPQDAGGIIRRSAEHLTNIVDGLLDISRIESGVLKLNRDIVPLPAFLDSLVSMFRMQAENKGLQFHYLPAANLPAFVRTD